MISVCSVYRVGKVALVGLTGSAACALKVISSVCLSTVEVNSCARWTFSIFFSTEDNLCRTASSVSVILVNATF